MKGIEGAIMLVLGVACYELDMKLPGLRNLLYLIFTIRTYPKYKEI